MIYQFFRRIFGFTKADTQAHDIRNQVTRDVLKVQVDMRRAQRQIKNTTAYKIYLATGGEHD